MNLDGVDVAWVEAQLHSYVEKTQPVNQSSGSVITARNAPLCGRPEAMQLTEVVRPILLRLYPEWQSENAGSKYDEFKAERDAARRLLARLATNAEVSARLGGTDNSPKLSASALHSLIWKAAEAQWLTGHRHEAVLAAAKAVNSHLQARLGRRDASEADLIRQAFSEKPPEPGKPRLRFDKLADEQSRESLRQGVMSFGAGSFQAIRNPVGHLPNEELELTEQTALERLASLSLLARWIDEAAIHEESA